jgi:hypothetical protein
MRFPAGWIVVAVLGLAACGDGGGGGGVGGNDAGAGGVDGGGGDAAADARPDRAPVDAAAAIEFFRPEVVHQIELFTDATTWNAFMQEHRTFDGTREPTWFTGEIVIDGTRLPDVGFHSFGWGSRDENKNKPNLSLDFERNVPGRSLRGIERMRIKNNGQDVTGLRQTIIYQAMREANLMAPRSTFALLTVNREVMGFFMVEESFSKPFVRERTGNDDGPAYEPRGCQGLVAPAPGGCASLPQSFTRNFNDMVGAGEDLVALCQAVNGPPEQFLGAVAPLIDVDEWIAQLAIDTALTGNHDGFSVTGSNFRLYQDSDRKKLRFVVIGPDETFLLDQLPRPSFMRPEPRDSCARDNPAFRDIFLEKLVATPQGLALYQQAVRKLRTGVMAADTLKARVDALWAIIGTHVQNEPLRVDYMEPEERKEEIKQYIDARWPALEAAGF